MQLYIYMGIVLLWFCFGFALVLLYYSLVFVCYSFILALLFVFLFFRLFSIGLCVLGGCHGFGTIIRANG